MCFFCLFIFKTINVNVDYCAIRINWPFRGCFSTVWIWCKNTIKSGNKQVFIFSVQILLIFKRITYRINMLFQSINVEFVRLQVSNWNQLWLFKSICYGNIIKQMKMNKWWNIGEHHFNMNEFLAWEFVRIPCSNYLHLFWLLVIKVYLIFSYSLVHVRRSVILYDF